MQLRLPGRAAPRALPARRSGRRPLARRRMTLGQLCLVAALLVVIGVTQLLSLRSTQSLDRATKGFNLAQNLTGTVADAQRDALGTQVAIQKVALGTGTVAQAHMQAGFLGQQLATLLPQDMPEDARAQVEHAARDQDRLLGALARLDGAPRAEVQRQLPGLQGLAGDLASDMRGLYSRFEVSFYDRMRATLAARAARQRWILGGAMLACLIGAGLAWSLRRAVRRDFERAYALLLDETEEREVAQEEALRAARELEHLALHDRLTGLPNRLRFERELDALGAAGAAGAGRGAVASVDLDGLGALNRTFGETVGDELLMTSAARLVGAAGAGAFVAHLGGDEFAVVWSGELCDAGAEARARELVAALAEPVIAGGRRVMLTGSAGVAAGSLADGQGHELLRNADAALHTAKIEGASVVAVFDEARHRELQERSAVAARLSRAESSGELELHYQPLVHAGEGSAAGLEGLLRWNRDGRLVPPCEFIPVAEESGLIVPMGAWAIDRVCRDLRALRATPAGGHLYGSVNLSAAQLRDPDLVPHVGACLARHGLPPGSLVVELTESAIVDDHAQAARVLAALRAIGVRVAIDDFGTGYSSLGYLKQIPADILKIDRSLIADITSDERSVRLLEGIVSLAHDLGMQVTVEGVETEEQLELVRAAGCDTVQGFLVARPEPLDAVHGLLDRLPAPAQVAAQGVPLARAAR